MKKSPEPSGKSWPEAIENQNDFLALPSPKIDLRDAHAIRRELAAVYRDMRLGKIETQHGTRLAYVLDMIRKAFETGVIQERIEFLEHLLKHRRKIDEE